MAPTDVVNRSSQRSIPIWLFALVLALIVGRVVMRQVPDRTEKGESLVKWVEPDQATRLAEASGKPIMYEFTAAWCPPCRQMEREVFNDPALAEQINRRFIPVKLTDRRREEGTNPPDVSRLQNRYSVHGFPTLVFADASGNLRRRLDGYGGRAAFEQQLASISQ